MKLTFLGTSHGVCEKNQFCSSIAVTVGRRSYLIDAGAPIMGLLKNYEIPYTSLGGIFITHAHPDHYMGLPEFIGQVEWFEQQKDVRLPVYVPPEFPYAAINTFLFGNPEGIVRGAPGGNRRVFENTEKRVWFATYQSGVIFDDGAVKITAVPVKHIPNAHAFLLEAEGKRVLFSGDLKHDLSDYPAVLTEGEGVDLLVMEAAHPLLNAPENIVLFQKTRTKHMIVTHRYIPYNTDTVVADLREAVKDLYPVDLAGDGSMFENRVGGYSLFE